MIIPFITVLGYPRCIMQWQIKIFMTELTRPDHCLHHLKLSRNIATILLNSNTSYPALDHRGALRTR